MYILYTLYKYTYILYTIYYCINIIPIYIKHKYLPPIQEFPSDHLNCLESLLNYSFFGCKKLKLNGIKVKVKKNSIHYTAKLLKLSITDIKSNTTIFFRFFLIRDENHTLIRCPIQIQIALKSLDLVVNNEHNL